MDRELVAALFERLRDGDRTALARSITLVESTLEGDREHAAELIARCLPHSGNSLRLGITGIPGVGKSTFINAFGLALLAAGHRPAILAVDPSSTRSGGSILGDKTRMQDLSAHPEVFIRPSPTGGELGGLARRTRESMLLCEAAGFDRILLETVGTGQSELEVDLMTDLVILLAIPGAGDELQGVKRGIMEIADFIAVNKADQVDAAVLERTMGDLRNAVHLLPSRSGRTAKVVPCSSITATGIDELLKLVETTAAEELASGVQEERRRSRSVSLLRRDLTRELFRLITGKRSIKEALDVHEAKVRSGEEDPFQASQAMITLIRKGV
ncbi:MAG: methylmalonyl Co-A mutase-associated GTPase MeaB [Flavobacteriales bacterium]|nr:methylmalonyl Co-A mutase-associated GTPase MeaB [Flavobacteriales bacterium]